MAAADVDMNFRPVSPMSLGSDEGGDDKDEAQNEDDQASDQVLQETESISSRVSSAGGTFFSCNDSVKKEVVLEQPDSPTKGIGPTQHASKDVLEREDPSTQDAVQKYGEKANQKMVKEKQEPEEAKITDEERDEVKLDTENRNKGEGHQKRSDKKHTEARDDAGASRAGDPSQDSPETMSRSTTPDPEKLFNNGETVIVDIVMGTYKKCQQGRIIAIKRKVKVSIQDNTPSGKKDTWLARTSLSYMGTQFPLYEEANSQGGTNGANHNKNKVKGANKAKDATTPCGSQQSKTFPDQNFETGDCVAIVGGTYKHKKGTVLQVKTRVKVAIVKVAIDGSSRKTPWLDKNSLRKSDSPVASSSTSLFDKSLCDFHSCDGTEDSKVSAPFKSRSSNTNKSASKYFCDDDLRLVDSDKGGERLGLRRLVKSRFQLARQEDTLLAYWFQNRMKVVEVPINDKELEEPFPKEFVASDGSKFELAVSKIQSDGDIASPNGVPSRKCIHLYYCQVSGPGLQTISLQQEFERIADFASLSPQKVCARLELFLSPAYKTSKKTHAIHMVNNIAFCEIKDTGNEGCGFISGELLIELLGGGKAAERAYAIQVRGSAAFGMFKGMLVKKMIKQGDAPIQIPSSMLVVGPSSRASDSRERGFLVINRNGVHPNTTNGMIDRLLRGVRTTQTFRRDLQRKKVSEMILRLWQGLGVPEQICAQYSKESQKEEKLQHAFVVGLADPTAELPAGSVYIPGLNHSGEIFVTRSPCLEASDARLVLVVTSRPTGMSWENWRFLQAFSFGSIIFANPKPGEKPMPVMIADGDLDGDLYLLCWQEQILEHIQAVPLDPSPDDQESRQSFPYRENWFTTAQDRMVDARSTQLVGQIIGKLWGKAKTIAEGLDDFTNNEEYKAFAAAYKEALKIGKHGGKIYLPARLHENLPAKFHYVLTDVKN